MLLDMIATFVNPLEAELGIKSNHRIGRFSDASKSKATTTGLRRSISAWRMTMGR